MNAQLYDSFKSLNDLSKAEIREKLKDSPVGMKLFDFLEKNKNRNFRNRDVVEQIYTINTDKTSYQILENRYFKLRKKFMEEYFAVKVEKDEFLAEEELELLNIRKLLHRNEKDVALQALISLEQKCWEKNIFELLPSVIDNLIFCKQLLNKMSPNDEAYSRMDKAIQTQAAINRVTLLARKVYDINYRKGISHAKKELAEMKEISKKFKDYPRFSICYHHVSLYYKLGSSDYIEDMQVISRHFREVKQSFSLYSSMPLIVYRRNYNLYQQMHYRQMIMFYHYNRCEFEEAYKMMKEFWDRIFSEPHIYNIYRSESIYFNMLNCQRLTQRFTDAEQTLNEYAAFLKENKNTARLPYAYTLRAMLYADAYPKLKHLQPEMLMQKVDEYLKQVKSDSNVQTSYGDAMVTKARLLFIMKDYKGSYNNIRDAGAVSYLENNSIKDVFIRFFEFHTRPGKNSSEDLRKIISKEILNARKPLALMYLKWMQKMLK